jgi:hypothetical protein
MSSRLWATHHSTPTSFTSASVRHLHQFARQVLRQVHGEGLRDEGDVLEVGDRLQAGDDGHGYAGLPHSSTKAKYFRLSKNIWVTR